MPGLTLRIVDSPHPWPTTVAALTAIEERVQKAEHEGLSERWEFGRELVRVRVGKVLPPGLLAVVMESTKLGKSEIAYRMQLATAFPTRKQLSDAIGQWPSWYQMTHKGLVKKRRTKTATRREAWRKVVERLCATLHGIQPDELSAAEVEALAALGRELARINSEVRRPART
jgi:hypothetical protein